jgi:hypothetical protein
MGSIAHKPGHLATAHPVSNHEDPVQTVIVARPMITANLILQRQNHRFGIGDAERLHALLMN